MSSEEEKYRKLRESLRSLPKLKTKNDFEARLYRKIRERESSRVHIPEKENTFVTMLANLFRPSLVPAIGLTVVILAAIIVYFAYFNELIQDKQAPTVQTYDEKKGEFVIYVKKDSERVYDETARDITSSELNHSTTGEEYKPSTDADYYKLSQPEVPSETDAEKRMKEDRISDEQKKIMEKESELKKESDDYKSQPKSEDGKTMKKGYNENIEAPLNIREEKEDTGVKNEMKLENQEQTAPEDELNQGVDTSKKSGDERKKRLKKDSLKTKEKGIEEQKDTIEK